VSIGIIGNTMKKRPKVVIDTNVLVAGLRSRHGASFKLLSQLERDVYELCLTVPLLMEYEDVLSRKGMVPLGQRDVNAILDMVCRVATAQEIHFLWRPQLRDPKDELVLKAAQFRCQPPHYTTLRISHAHRFNVRVVSPRDFLSLQPGEP
jgi:putative PIN family toxin of toxin-antitoxin system